MAKKYNGKKVVHLNKDRGAWAHRQTGLIHKDTEIVLKSDPRVPDLFKIRKKFVITVPEDFDGSIYLKSFIERYRRRNRKEKESFILHASMGYLLNNFIEKAPCRIEQGATYEGIIYQSIKRGICKNDCLNFIEKVNGFSPGAEGLALTLEQAAMRLWGVRSLVTFNDPKSPMKDENGKEKAMQFLRYNIPSCGWQLLLIDADITYGRSDNDCLLVFFKK